MKIHHWIGGLLTLPLAYRQNVVYAGTPVASQQEYLKLIGELPTCALNCLTSLLNQTTCEITDLPCLCSNYDYQDVVTVCVRRDCILSEALFTKNITETACGNPVQDKSGSYTAMNLTTGTFTVILTTARLLFKKFFSRSGKIGPDDGVIVLAVLVGIPGIVVNQVGLIGHGLGRDIWTLAPTELPIFAMYFYIMEVIYITEMSLIKLSLSLFYLYVFPGTKIRRLLMATAIFNVVFGIAFALTCIFGCTPVTFTWKQYQDFPPPGKCVDLNRFAWANASLNLAVDIWMIVLPITQIRKLDLHWKKKIGVFFMFLIGTFATVIALVRLKSVIFFATLVNPTMDQLNVAFWSTMEVNIGVICTCLPTVRLIFMRLFPKMMQGTEVGRSLAASSRNVETTSRLSTAVPPPPPYSHEERGTSMELASTTTIHDIHHANSSEKPYENV